MKRKISSVMLFVLSVVLLTCALTFSTGAEERATPAVSIEKFNLVFEDNVYLKYAVKFNGVEESKITENNIGMLYFKAPSVAYVAGNEDFSSGVVGYTTIGGEKYYTFEYRHVSAKQMTDYVYSVAYIDIGGERYYSTPNKFSVLEYCCSKLGKTGVASTNEDYKNLLTVTLEQGAMAQKYFGYKTERPANAEYYLVEVIGGTLADGFSRGLYHGGETAILTAPETNGELAFFGWQNSAGKIVSADARFEVSEFLQNETYTAVYKGTCKHENAIKLDAVAPTCTESGLTEGRYCPACEEILIAQETIDALGHTVETWNKKTAPTAMQSGTLVGTCAECGECMKMIPAFNTTDYTYAVEVPSCLSAGKETWTYTLGEQAFTYNVMLPAKGHSVGGTPVNQLKMYNNAFVYGQAGIIALNVSNPKCETIIDGYYVCSDCGMSQSIKVYGGDHVWGEATTVPNCILGTQAVRKCTVEGCDAKDTKTVDDRLEHGLVYGLVEEDGAFKFTTKCVTCTTQDSSIIVTDFVLLDLAGSKVSTCSEAGYNKYVYEYAAGKTVSCNVTIPLIAHHFVVDGVVVKPDANGYYSSAYIGKGITVLVDEGEEYPDVVTCGNTYNGFFVCVCGMNQSVTIINPHTYTYILVEDGDLWKVVGDCNTCYDMVEYTGLAEYEFEEEVVPSTCTTQGTYTITLKKQIAGVTVPPLVTKLGLAPHSVEAGKLLTDCELASEGVYKYNTKYFTALDLSDFICGETVCFDGYFRCSECGGVYSVKLAADHLYRDYTVVVEPTCTEPGKKVATCIKCGAKDEAVVDPPYHRDLSAVVTVAPTVTAGGIMKIACSCGASYNCALPALTNTAFYAEFEITEDDSVSDSSGAQRYTGKISVPASGLFGDEELDVAFTVPSED